jgi:ribosome maturation factor RimP
VPPTWEHVRTTQDEELAVASDAPLRSARLPTPAEVTELLTEEFARHGCVIEDVEVQASSRPPRITVIADGDDATEGHLDLDLVAELGRTASELMDQLDEPTGAGPPYVLEVTSRGVDRPLTAPRHYRRAQGRKVELTLSDGSRLDGRLGPLADDAVSVVVADGARGKYAVRSLPLTEISNAVVQVEFSPPNRRELELAGLSGEEPAG